jgi:hypothetical protein
MASSAKYLAFFAADVTTQTWEQGTNDLGKSVASHCSDARELSPTKFGAQRVRLNVPFNQYMTWYVVCSSMSKRNISQPTASRQALGPTQAPIQKVPGVSFPGGEATGA